MGEVSGSDERRWQRRITSYSSSQQVREQTQELGLTQLSFKRPVLSAAQRFRCVRTNSGPRPGLPAGAGAMRAVPGQGLARLPELNAFTRLLEAFQGAVSDTSLKGWG